MKRLFEAWKNAAKRINSSELRNASERIKEMAQTAKDASQKSGLADKLRSGSATAANQLRKTIDKCKTSQTMQTFKQKINQAGTTIGDRLKQDNFTSQAFNGIKRQQKPPQDGSQGQQLGDRIRNKFQQGFWKQQQAKETSGLGWIHQKLFGRAKRAAADYTKKVAIFIVVCCFAYGLGKSLPGEIRLYMSDKKRNFEPVQWTVVHNE